MNKKNILQVITIVLLALWIPSVLDKLVHFTTFKHAVLRQHFPHTLAYIVSYAIPVLEAVVVFLLVWPRYRRWGFALSTLLMAVFTGYIGLALSGAWGKIPCGCGSIISGMSWAQHLWFNLFFLIVSIIGLSISKFDSKPSRVLHPE